MGEQESYFVLYPTLQPSIYCEQIANYSIYPGCKILGKRLSPYFIYSQHYGYIKSFDEQSSCPILVEENILQDYEYTVEICDPNGAHLYCVVGGRSTYYQTLTHRTKSTVLSKVGPQYWLQPGSGWTEQFYQQILPNKKKKKIFRFFPIKNPFLIVVNDRGGAEILDSSLKKENLPFGTLLSVHKKGFEGDKMIVYTNRGIIDYKKISLVGAVPTSALESFHTKGVCVICQLETINTVFLHGDFGHSFSCFGCSQKLLSTSCPICRLPIDKIVLLYS
jgi:hypothetical protein